MTFATLLTEIALNPSGSKTSMILKSRPVVVRLYSQETALVHMAVSMLLQYI